MASQEFYRKLQEIYNPTSFKARRNLFPTQAEKEQQEAERQQQSEADHLALRALLQQRDASSEDHSEPSERSAPTRRSKKKKK